MKHRNGIVKLLAEVVITVSQVAIASPVISGENTDVNLEVAETSRFVRVHCYRDRMSAEVFKRGLDIF